MMSANNYYEIGQFDSGKIEYISSTIHPSQMLALDSKLDDGANGSFGSKVFGYTAYDPLATATDTCNGSVGNYDVANDSSRSCIAFVQIGINSGNPR